MRIAFSTKNGEEARGAPGGRSGHELGRVIVDDFVFENRVAVITGAGGGIGKALAERFADAGMKLVLSDVDEGALSGVVGTLRSRGVEVCSTRVDVASQDDVTRLAALAFDSFGSVDLLCNNAAFRGRPEPVGVGISRRGLAVVA